MPTIKIKPASGLTVRDPQTKKPLADKGEEKEKNSYWLKRLRDGDVVLVADTKKGDK